MLLSIGNSGIPVSATVGITNSGLTTSLFSVAAGAAPLTVGRTNSGFTGASTCSTVKGITPSSIFIGTVDISSIVAVGTSGIVGISILRSGSVF